LALRPPSRRRTRARRRDRRVPDEVIGLIAGYLIASFTLRLVLACAGVERWTTAWRVVDAATIALVWPFEAIGIGGQGVVGAAGASDVVAAAAAIVLGLYLLATRTITRSA
jgi:hypothetical protein